MIAKRQRCLTCSGYGYVPIWSEWIMNGMRHASFREVRCPICRMRKRDRLDWLLASMRQPGSLLRIT